MEIPVGTINGSNATFTVSAAPAPEGIQLFLNGLLQQEGVDFAISGTTITYAVAPKVNDWHIANIVATGDVATTGTSFFYRTLLLRDLATGDDIADHEMVYLNRTLLHIYGWLRKTIAATLTMRFSVRFAGLTHIVGTFSIPATQAIDTPIEFNLFSYNAFPHKSILVADITASDGSQDANGVAAFTFVFYGPEAGALTGVSNHGY